MEPDPPIHEDSVEAGPDIEDESDLDTGPDLPDNLVIIEGE